MENNINNLAEEPQTPSEQYLNFVAYAYVDGELLINYEMMEKSSMNESFSQQE